MPEIEIAGHWRVDQEGQRRWVDAHSRRTLPETTTKVVGLSRLNVRALDECFPKLVSEGTLRLGKTTAEWTMLTPDEAKAEVDAMIASLDGRSHPKASLWAVSRRLGAIEC